MGAGCVRAAGPSYGVYNRTQTASDAGSEDHFGSAVGLDGDTLVVGAPLNDDSQFGSGSVYVFSRNQGGSGNWGQVQELNASDPGNGDEFGFSVDVEGDTILVGAPYDNDQGGDSGSVYLFQRNQGGADNWGQVAKLTNTTGAAGDEFGFDVAIDGDTAVVGAPLDDDGGSQAGAVHVFSRNEGGSDQWGQVTTLTASDAALNDRFGYAVDIDGNDVVVGARDETSTGAIYLFAFSGTWTQTKKKRAGGALGDDNFGRAVAIENGRVLVGAPQDNSQRGTAFIFERNQGGVNQWGQVKRLTAGDSAPLDQFGRSVALSGSVALVGAHEDHVGIYGDAGSAYVFHRDAGGAGNWGESAKLVGNNPSSLDNTGTGVALIDDAAVLGAPFEDISAGNAGAVYLYNMYFNQTPNINNQAFSILENRTNLSVVGTVVATDPDAGQFLTYQIASDPSGGAFSLHPTNGLLTVLDSSLVDYELSPQYVLGVKVVDSGLPPVTNEAQVTVFLQNIVEGADLRLTKTAVPVLSTTSNLMYTVEVSNLGPMVATNVVVTDALPPGVVYQPAGSSPACVESNGLVTCTLGNISGSQVVILNVVVETNTVGLITNSASATTTTFDDGVNSHFDSATTVVTDYDNDLDPDFHDPDDDNDLMPDFWEIQFGLNSTNASDAAGFADSDSFTNLEEYIADTDPTSELSYLKVDVISGPPPTFGFQSSTGRLYTIESSVDLPAETWTPVPGLSNFFGIGGADLRTNSSPATHLQYRLNVQLP